MNDGSADSKMLYVRDSYVPNVAHATRGAANDGGARVGN